ncbi:MAG: MFS transporter [Cetobacterium sp.]|uniref:MFS transporter n=1 Tax=Cetobacterium sp. TaxID=2071632 RepID=UPI003EE717F7
MLRNKNFIRLIIGSFISAIGSLGVNFLLSLYIFDNTKSINLLIFFNMMMLIPGTLVPLIIGPVVDSVNKKNIIINLDLIQFFIFLMITIFSKYSQFNYIFFLVLGLINISINTFYNIAFYAFIPDIVEKHDLQKVYSITSMMDPLIKVLIIPISIFLYTSFGIWIIFLINSLTYIIAVFIEKYISYEYLPQKKEHKSFFITFMENTHETIKYLKKEKGIKNIYIYFMIGMFGYSSIANLLYPFFEKHNTFSIQNYSQVMVAASTGLIIGGILHYFIKIPSKNKYLIALSVYILINTINAIIVYLPFQLMIITYFLYGVLSINSYNIRQTTTQVYIDANIRGRINGVFTVLNSLAMILGSILCMFLAKYLPYEIIITLFCSLGVLGAIKFIYLEKEEVKNIYNL